MIMITRYSKRILDMRQCFVLRQQIVVDLAMASWCISEAVFLVMACSCLHHNNMLHQFRSFSRWIGYGALGPSRSILFQYLYS